MTTIRPGETLAINMLMGGTTPFVDWQPMSSAPRDGTTIEVRCTYGVAPWYGLYHWIETPFGDRWAKVGDDNSSFRGDATFSWRSYGGGCPMAYADPTGGAQNTRAYWLRASGFNPRDYPGSELTFEEEDRLGGAKPKKRSLFERLFGL